MRPLAELDDQQAVAAARAASDLVLLLDADGVVLDVEMLTPDVQFDLGSPAAWPGRKWNDLVAPESLGAIDALIGTARVASQSGARPQGWRLVLHRPLDNPDVPLLFTVIRVGHGGHMLALARDLMGIDLREVVLRCEPAAVFAYATAMRARGTDLETLCLDTLATAARQLGVQWVEDRCDLLEVTEGVWLLQRAARDLAALEESLPPASIIRAPRILLAPVPGEQHVFGLSLLATFFRRAGWMVWEEVAPSAADLVALVEQEALDIVGLSLTCDGFFSGTPAIIREVRRASSNPHLRVLAGGNAFVARPQRAAEIGADGTASDARQTVLLASRLIAADAMMASHHAATTTARAPRAPRAPRARRNT